MADVIKEFQVGLRFAVDQSGKQSFDESLRKGGIEVDKLQKGLTSLTKTTVELGRSGVLAGIGFAKAIEQVTKNYQQLYYSAQQAQISAKELGGLEAGFRAFGASGADAAGAIQSMTLAMKRSGGGLEAWTRQITGVDVSKIASGTGTATERMKEFNALIDWMAKQTGPQGAAIRAQVGQMYGWSQSQIELWIANKDRMRRGFEDFQKVMDEAGVNVDDLAKKSADYQETLSQTTTRFTALWSQTAQTLMPVLQPMTEQLNKLLDLGIQWEKEHPWAGAALTFAGMAASAELILKAVKGLSGAVGLGGAAKEAETAATGIGAAMGKGFKTVVYGAAAFEIGYSIGDAARQEIEKTELGKKILDTIGGGIAGMITGSTKGGAGSAAAQAAVPLAPELQLRIMELQRKKRAGTALTPAEQQILGKFGGEGPDYAAEAGPQLGYQKGGIVTATLHEGEMVLPPALSQGIQDIISGGGTAGTASRKMSDWLSGSAGAVPRVKIDNSEELAQALPGALQAGGGLLPGGAAAATAAAVASGSIPQPAPGTGLPTSMAAPGKGGRGDPRGMIPVIRAAAAQYGIDPETAIRVARSEGLAEFKGDQGRSGGAFQLFTGGGLGNEFKKETGLDPLDPKNESATIYWAMRKVRSTGWGPWHGAAKIGVRGFAGIGALPSGPAIGGAAPGGGATSQDMLQANWAARTGALGTPEEAGRNLVTVKAPNGAKFQVNKQVAGQFQGFLNELYATGYKDIVSGGGYANRPIRGGTTASEHAYGAAIDINPEENPMLQGRLMTNMPKNIGEIAAKYNLKWGGSFSGRKDPMHFEAAGFMRQRPLGAPQGGETQMAAGGAVAKTVNMTVQHTVNITTPQGTPGEHVRAWAGAQKRHFADLHRNLQSAMT